MSLDIFSGHSDTPSAPARACFAVSPSDTENLPRVPKALYVGTSGDITLRCADDNLDVIFRNVPAGMILDIRVTNVRASGTTAADIVALA
ncbi:hypothetical protein HME9302_00885 [Alteripontixanthobacter maritimus]|uniref:Uncharacterized protein n=1 Tax=Alteripontixanthobacter maritimus TaxID=2161824 RepID=A0A369Q482_9SPHN|nr:hypothetical protein [Alteripontixanthobacter maritimus]RDC59693.1 hypothetical protein HME9302_00885 [Alteripontixanthobacter maritimus]